MTEEINCYTCGWYDRNDDYCYCPEKDCEYYSRWRRIEYYSVPECKSLNEKWPNLTYEERQQYIDYFKSIKIGDTK